MTTLQKYIDRYYGDSDIDVSISGDTLTTYQTFNDYHKEFNESVDTYKLINNAKQKGYTVVRIAAPKS